MEQLYDQYRALLFTLAYQLTGSAADAEDAVQDVFVKACDIQTEHLEEPKAYLCKMVTNHCLNLMKSARKKREMYVGPWLPEPIRTSEGNMLETTVVHRDLLSYAMLVLLERLTPAERTVFVLRVAMDFDYPEIAELLDKREANCRKLMSRAKSKMGITGEEPIASDAVEKKWVSRFLDSLQQGDVDHVISLLTEDVMIVSDGGGKVNAFRQPVRTREHVARILIHGFHGNISAAFGNGTHYFEIAPLNGETGIVVHSGNETLAAMLLQIRGGKLARMYAVGNPDKLVRV